MQRAPSHYDAASPAPGSLGPRRLLVVAGANPDRRGSCLLTARSSLYRVRLGGATLIVAFAPEDCREIFRTLAPDFLLLPQQGSDLSSRRAGILEHLLASGHAGAVAIDSDTPTLPPALLQQAVDALTDPKPDVAVGPTEDGGYYLIGLRAPQPELFVEMPWSTSAVLRETTTRAQRRGLRLVQLPCWHDVDTPADLDRLRAELAGTDESVAPHTRRFLQQSRPTGARTLGA